MSARRLDVTAEETAALNARLLDAALASDAAVIGAVWPLPGEPDLRGLCAALRRAGRVVALPETTPKGQSLIFRRWHEDARMLEGRFGTAHPEGPPVLPGILLVPLLAFDRAGHRLGYGGGYYDRTLAALGVPGIGFGFSFQEVPSVPAGPHDVPLDRIVTEREVIRIGQGRDSSERLGF